MQTKLFEIRDRNTFIPCIAICVSGEDGYLARRAGYGPPCILFGKLEGGKFEYDQFNWKDRTMNYAHDYISSAWDELKSGDVIVLLRETDKPKESEENALS